MILINLYDCSQYNYESVYDDEYDDRDDDDVTIPVPDNPVTEDILTFNPNRAGKSRRQDEEEEEESESEVITAVIFYRVMLKRLVCISGGRSCRSVKLPEFLRGSRRFERKEGS